MTTSDEQPSTDLTVGDDVAETDEAEHDTEDRPASDQPANIARVRRRALFAFGFITILSALASASFLSWQLLRGHQVDTAGREAQSAAVATAEALTSIDSNEVDANFADILNRSTGAFREMYTQSSTQLRQLVIDNKATASGTVVDSAIQSQTEARVVVLLMVDQTISNTSVSDPRIDRSRMKLTMENVDGRWLVSEVELV